MTGRLVRGEIEVRKDGPGGDWLVEVLATDGSGSPTNTTLAAATVPDASVPLGESRIGADFVATSSIAAGKQYALSVGRTDSNWWIRYRTGDVCPGANFASTIGGPWAPVPPFGGNQMHEWVISVFVDPTNEFSLGQTRGRLITVTIPGPGAIEVHDAATAPRTTAGKTLLKTSSVRAAGAGTVSVPLELTKRAKRKLGEAGQLRLGAAITFTPTGGSARTQTTRLKLKKKTRR